MAKKIDLSKLIAVFVSIERMHYLLRSYIPQYTEWSTKIIDKIKKKFRFKKTILDDILSYTGIKDGYSLYLSEIRLIDKAAKEKLFCILPEKYEFVKAYRLSPEFTANMDINPLEAFQKELLPLPCTPETTLLQTYVVGKTLETLEQKSEKLINFFKPAKGLSFENGIFYFKHNGMPFIVLIELVDEPNANHSHKALLYSSDETNLMKLASQLNTELKAYNRYASAILTSFDGVLNFKYDEEQTIALRLSNFNMDLSFYGDEVKRAVNGDILQFLARRSGRRSYLLAGPPGGGKTRLIKNIISILPVEFTVVIIDKSGIGSLHYMNTSFTYVKPLCVVIEDIDLIIDDNDRRQILLNFLDGISSRTEMLTIMTANKPSVLGHVFLRRPGRIDRIVKILPGELTERVMQLGFLTKGLTVPMDLKDLSALTEGFTFAQHREFIDRARLYSGNKNILDKNNMLAALDECKEQFSTDVEDWTEIKSVRKSGLNIVTVAI